MNGWNSPCVLHTECIPIAYAQTRLRDNKYDLLCLRESIGSGAWKQTLLMEESNALVILSEIRTVNLAGIPVCSDACIRLLRIYCINWKDRW
jgi:hypothetical protein